MIRFELFAKIDSTRTEVAEEIKYVERDGYYSLDKTPITVLAKLTTHLYKRFATLNGIEKDILELEKKFNSQNSMKIELDISGDGNLYLNAQVDDRQSLNIFMVVISRFFYDVFDTEVEF